MSAQLSSDQLAIRDGARDFLLAQAGFDRLRMFIDSGTGWDQALWRSFGLEMGFAGIGVAEDLGGSGLGLAELVLIAEELGRTLAPIPWFESAVLSAGILEAVGENTYLPRIAAGELIATYGRGAPDCLTLRADTILSGRVHHVPFGAAADVLVLQLSSEVGDASKFIVIDANTTGITVEARTSLDMTRPLSVINFDNVAIPAEAIFVHSPAVEQVMMRAAIVLAAELVGVMARSLEETVDYAKQRVQFDRVIGSFQAVKHRLADMKLHLEAARSAVGWAAADGAMVAANAALAQCKEAALIITGDAIQLHGGIGFTWEHHAHLFFKRARANAALLGSAQQLREKVAEHVIG